MTQMSAPEQVPEWQYGVEDLGSPQAHAELVEGPAGRYWLAIQPAGSLVDPVFGGVEESLTLAAIGWTVNKVVFLGRWSVRLLVATPEGVATRQAVFRRRVCRSEVLALAVQLKQDVEMGRRP